MSPVLLFARFLLAGVFVIAGFANLANLTGSRAALRDIGVPGRLSSSFGVLLPLIELGVAVALLPATSAWWGAVSALVLFLLFVAGIGSNLARGRTPDCRCLGQLRSAPAGWSTLIRTLVLALLAGVVVWFGRGQPALSALAWASRLTVAELLCLLGFLGLVGAGWLLWQLLLQQGRLLLRLETVEVRQNVAGLGHPAGGEHWVGEAEERIELTIGMTTSNDYDGVYFTLQALRLYQDLSQTELLVIDNYGCPHTEKLVEAIPGARYIRATEVVGTAAPRDLLFKEAQGDAVLCCDCHVLLAPGAIDRLKQFYRAHPACQDLLQGPMLYDDGKQLATHMDPVWKYYTWGKWASDPRGQDEDGEPFEIPMQGLGVFSCRKQAWLGFHPQFRGYGGEEGYIHEKFRQAGRRCLCLPWLRWMHRFSRPGRVISPLTAEERLRNYVLGHTELGLDLAPVLHHFSAYLPEERVMAIAEQARAEALTGSGPLDISIPPLVSVVMPVYNGERYLRVAVRSLLRQTLQPIEIIIINDGSTDHTEQILGELAADPRVRPVHLPHLGIPRARNTGIALAQAKYIAVHDADDLSLPDRLAKQYAFLEQFPDVALVGSFANIVNETGQFIRGRGGIPTDPPQIAERLRMRNFLVHGSVMMRTAAVEAVGRYREAFALAEDYDLYLRLAEHFQLANLAEVLYLYRSHADSVSLAHRQVQNQYAFIARELAEERRQTGSDLLEREGGVDLLNAYSRDCSWKNRTPNQEEPDEVQRETSDATRWQLQEV